MDIFAILVVVVVVACCIWAIDFKDRGLMAVHIFLLLVVIAFITAMCMKAGTESVVAEAEHTYGQVASVEQRYLDRGPFWYEGKMPVYHVVFKDGRRDYVLSGRFSYTFSFE